MLLVEQVDRLSRLTDADWRELRAELDIGQLTLAAECIGKGLVRFCAPTVAKMQTRTIGAALALKAGDPVETALRSALITAIFLKYAMA